MTTFIPKPRPGEKGMLGRFGRYLEEFEVGDVYQHAHSITITGAMHHLFCAITMTHNPLHLDSNFAEHETQFGKNVVAGHMIYSTALGMSVPDVSGLAIANLEVHYLKHPAPVFHEDTIYAETEVLAVTPSKSKPDRGIVRVKTTVRKQDGTVVCEFERSVLIPKRNPTPVG